MKSRVVLFAGMLSGMVVPSAFAGFGNDSGLGNLASMGLIYLVVLLVLFLLAREFLCWYWKINRSIAVLEEISGSNKQMVEHLQMLVRNSVNSPEQQKILAESKKLEEQGELSAKEARKMRVPALNDRNVCPSCYKDYSKYVLTCEACSSQLQSCEVVAQGF